MRRACSNVLAIGFFIVLNALCPSANATVVTFENYLEGADLRSSFTDLPTNVTFFNPGRGTTPTRFIIEYAAASADAPMLPGHYLTGGGYAPGDGASVSTNFGFDANLPRGAGHVSMDVLVSTDSDSGSLTLTGFDSAGLPVASSTIMPVGSFIQAPIGIDAPLDSIRTISVRASGLSTGYDNLTFTPEPSSAAAVILGVLAFSTRRPKR